MTIKIVKGTGVGRTAISAFDAALWSAGIANHNLVCLSSILPPKSTCVVVDSALMNEKGAGDRLYVVLARRDQNVPGCHAWAGLGWEQNTDGSGVFVEHSADSENELKNLIKKSLEDLSKRRKYKNSHHKMVSIGIQCVDEPVCAVVAAIYKSEKWR